MGLVVSELVLQQKTKPVLQVLKVVDSSGIRGTIRAYEMRCLNMCLKTEQVLRVRDAEKSPTGCVTTIKE